MINIEKISEIQMIYERSAHSSHGFDLLRKGERETILRIKGRVLRVIDSEGYRANVGIILVNAMGGLFWAKRIGENAWQFPQGGIRESESAEQAVFRELHEEVGVSQNSVEVIGSTEDWLRYQIPEHLIRRHQTPCCIGQKQRWFLLRFKGKESEVSLDSSDKPEFDQWRWVDHLEPPRSVISFKRDVYAEALKELLPLIN